jgi:hypothetical protein
MRSYFTRLLQKLAVALPGESFAAGPFLQVMTLPEEFTLGGVQKQWIGKPQRLAGGDLEANQAIFLMQLAGLGGSERSVRLRYTLFEQLSCSRRAV